MTSKSLDTLESLITAADLGAASPATQGDLRIAVGEAINLLDSGKARIAQRDKNGQWHVNSWLKKAILLHFRLQSMDIRSGGSEGGVWWDKIPSKFATWNADDFTQAGFRAVPGAIVRQGAHIAPGAVLMPSFVNIGAYVGAGSMIDTWATVGSCAQIGANVHISGGVGIGGILEPLQAAPVIIEDNVFIGARSEIAEGVILREGAVLSMGVYLGASTKIIDRTSGAIHIGEVPPYAVVVPGSLPGRPLPNGGTNTTPGPALYCAVIVKQVDAQTRAKTSVNALLRD